MKHLNLVALLLVAYTSLGQALKTARYIDRNGDEHTIWLEKSNFNYNPDQFILYSNTGKKTGKLNLADIQELTIEDHTRFKRANVAIEQSTNNIGNLSYSEKPEFKNEEVLLRVLIAGTASLYELRQRAKTNFFYKIEGDSIKPLVSKTYQTQDNVVKMNNQFQEELWNNVKCGDTEISELVQMP